MTRLDAIRKRCQQATNGPWHWAHKTRQRKLPSVFYGEQYVGFLCDVYDRNQDAEFIAHSRGDVEWLLGRLDAATKLLEEIETHIIRVVEIERDEFWESLRRE